MHCLIRDKHGRCISAVHSFSVRVAADGLEALHLAG